MMRVALVPACPLTHHWVSDIGHSIYNSCDHSDTHDHLPRIRDPTPAKIMHACHMINTASMQSSPTPMLSGGARCADPVRDASMHACNDEATSTSTHDGRTLAGTAGCVYVHTPDSTWLPGPPHHHSPLDPPPHCRLAPACCWHQPPRQPQMQPAAAPPC